VRQPRASFCTVSQCLQENPALPTLTCAGLHRCHAPLQTVADRLAAQLHDLRYQHAVQHISWGSDSVAPGRGDDSSASVGGSSCGVSIACANGATLQADVALVTLPLGVLKVQHRQLFSPPLPPAKVAAIERMRIGTVDKLFLDFTPPTGGSGQAPAAAPAAAAAAGGSNAPGASEAGPVVSYALLWSCPWEGASSSSGSSGAAGPLAAEPGEAELPGWAKGVFSLRFGGPEVKRPEASSTGSARGSSSGRHDGEQAEDGGAPHAADDEYNPCAEAAQPTCYHAVAWLSGAAATAMEAATDEEVLAALRRLPECFPQLQLPPGASWDEVKLHR
jgi:spermine oxidase